MFVERSTDADYEHMTDHALVQDINKPGFGLHGTKSKMDQRISRQKRLQSAVSAHLEEKRCISAHFLRVYGCVFDRARDSCISLEEFRAMADEMIAVLNRDRAEFEKLRNQYTELQKRTKSLEMNKQKIQALLEISKEQARDRNQFRRLKASRRSEHGWSNPASKWAPKNKSGV
jgi:hypothetical protein